MNPTNFFNIINYNLLYKVDQLEELNIENANDIKVCNPKTSIEPLKDLLDELLLLKNELRYIKKTKFLKKICLILLKNRKDCFESIKEYNRDRKKSIENLKKEKYYLCNEIKRLSISA